MVGFWKTTGREIRRMGSRKMYLLGMIVVPLACIFFFSDLLSEGLPLKVPSAIVDLDHSEMSRDITRNLSATELIDITCSLESYEEAMAAVRRGEIFGFFVIPANFQKDALSNRTPTVEFFNNLTYFVPGTLTFKGFKTVAVSETAGLVRNELVAAGMTDQQAMAFIQPLTVQEHPIANPWMNYNYYLTPSFCLGALALMIMLMSTFSITMEIKNGTSTQWLDSAHGSILVAMAAKLLPHFVVWSVVGQFMVSYFFCWLHFPCGHVGIISAAMELFILACMSMGVIFSSLVPTPRFALILCALVGILSFSVLGFSFPVQSMYGAVAIFAYLIPGRYFFLTYITSGLNGFPLYYSRIYMAAMIVFPLVAMICLPRLRSHLAKPVYVP